MKKFNIRVLSFILAVVAIFNSTPFIAYAFNQDASAQTLIVLHNNEPVEKALTLAGNDTLTLKAEAKNLDKYQWQIFIPSANTYVNIADMTERKCSISYALLENALDENYQASVRLTGEKDGVTMASAAVWISYYENLDFLSKTETKNDGNEDDGNNEEETTDGFLAKLRSSVSSFIFKVGRVFAANDISIPPCNCGYVGQLSLHDNENCDKKKYVLNTLSDGTYTADEIFEAIKGIPVVEQYQIADLIGQKNHDLADALIAKIKAAANALRTYTVTIKYQYNNEGPDLQGSVTADYVATIAENNKFIETIINPERTGYKAYLSEDPETDWNEEKGVWFYERDEAALTPAATLGVNITQMTENKVYYVIYMPQLVPYTVISYKQNVYNDFYTFHETKVYEGVNGALVGSSVLSAVGGLLDIPGFTRLSYEDAKVAADGSTVIELYYDREYRLMNFDLDDGGYGVEPIYARYGTSFKVVKPTRAGYDFINWEVEYAYDGYDTNGDPVKLTLDGSAYTTAKKTALENLNSGNVDIPEFDVMFKANWSPHPDVGCTIAYWRQDTVGDTYSYWGKKEIHNVHSGDTFDVENDIGIGMPASSVGLEDYKYFTYNSEKTLQENGATVEVSGEGSTIINVYYTRNEYTIRFVYARASVSTSTKEFVPQSSIISGNTYYIRGNKNKNNLTTQIAPLTAWGQGKYAVSTTSQGSPLTIEHVSNNTYRIKTQEATPRYLSIGNNEAGWTTTESTVTIEFTGSTCTIGSKLNSTTYYMNDFGGSGQYAAGWSGKDEGSIWEICSAEESIATNLNVQICTNTKYGYGLYPKNSTFYNLGDLGWTGNLGNNLPEITLPEDTDRFSNNNDYIEVSGYRYYYVTVTARYGDNITDAWPQASIGNIDSYSFGSWGASAACKYREKSPENANIIGPYPTMSAEMIEDPDNSIAQTMVAWWSVSGDVSEHLYHIYVEVFPGQNLTGLNTIIKDGVTYAEISTHKFTCAHNNNTRCDPIVYEGLNCISNGWTGARLTNRTEAGDYVMYTYYCSTGDANGRTDGVMFVYPNGFDSYYVMNGDSQKHYVYVTEADLFQKSTGTYFVKDNHFFYTRGRYTFSYYNRGSDKKPEGDPALMFGTELNSLHVVTDDQMQTDYYPDILEKDVYTFEGWYLTPECLPGTEVDWNTLTMPAAPLEVYAGWFPVKRSVTFYTTYSDYISNTPRNSYEVDHGSPVQYDSTISRDGYLFVGWFYFDGASDTKVAFLPNNMPVTKDIKIFAEWQNQETLIKYTIKYIAWQGNKDSSGEYVLDHCVIDINDDTGEPIFGGDDPNDAMEISTRTTGQFQEGRTKTFSAKAIPQLYPEFQHRYFPLLSSHAIMFVKDQDFSADEDLTLVEHSDGTYELIYTFNYVYLESMSYTVNYINTETGNNTFEVNGHEYIATPKTTTTTEAITTQRFLQINGYIPDEYQKQVVLTADPTLNVINFYYSKSAEPMYFVVHMTENLDGTWTEEKKEFGMASVGSVITRSADPAGTYPGHSYDPNFGLDTETGEYTWVTAEGLPITDQPGHGDLWVPDDNTINESNHYYRADTSNGTGTVSAALVEYHAIVIRFYYTLDSYGYRVEHKRYETGKWLEESGQLASTDNILSVDPIVYETKLKYGETFTGTSRSALAMGFWIEGHEDGSIATETKVISDKEENNVITFWYIDSPVEINYVMVIDDTIATTEAERMGNSLSVTLSNTRAHSDPNSIMGSQPTVTYGYRFGGWFMDEECKHPVTEAWIGENNKIQPQKGSVILMSANYYALFVPLNAPLTIYKEGLAAEDYDRISIFRIVGDPSGTYTKKVDLTVTVRGNGSTAISYLPLGSYTVTELTAWTWDYDSAQAQQTIQVKPIDSVNTENRVTFTESRAAGFIKWLAEESYVSKLFMDLVM